MSSDAQFAAPCNRTDRSAAGARGSVRPMGHINKD
jgi:hypothetical protein